MVFLLIYKHTSGIIIPHATSCGGYNDLDPSVSQSISPVFLVSATPLKPLDRISWNFVLMKNIMFTSAYPPEILIPFFSRSYVLFEIRNLAKMKDTTVFLVGATPLKSLNRISKNSVVIKDIMCRCTYPQTILFPSFFSKLRSFWISKFDENERYYWNSWSAQLHWNRSTELHQTL